MPAREAQIDRINELSQLARTAWFSLLGYLVFVGITLLGVKDADFFVPSRQTDLPLINVAIPTASFFWTAPILGAALYTYLHLFLIKLWDAHADARTTDADATHHWLVGDFVLIRQRDPVARARPLAFLTDWITRLLVWAAGPIVLGYAWWRSMPAHAEWMTLLIAACFWLTLVVGFTSWSRADFLFGPRPLRWSTGAAVPLAGLAALSLFVLSWLRTEGGLDNYAGWGWTLKSVSFKIPKETPVVRWFTSEELRLPLALTDLVGEELVVLPDNWRSPAALRSAFRETWCRREGVAMDACDQPAAPGRVTTVPVLAARTKWCGDEHGNLSSDECAAHFADLDHRFEAAWTAERQSVFATPPELDLSGRDLRHIQASSASLVGADLAWAQMDGADLSWAQMDGADLSGAQMDGANFHEAQMDGANLILAQMDGANLSQAQMDGANLILAQMDGANLSRAQMDGANLSQAQMDGANFHEAQMDGANLILAQMDGADLSWAQMDGANFHEAQMDGVNLRYVDLRKSKWAGASNRSSPAHFADLRGAQDLTQAQLDQMIGNAGTLLPDGDAPDTGAPFYIWSCWQTPPSDIDRIVATAAGRSADDADRRATLQATFVCGPDNPHRKFVTRLPVDAPYPPGHPLNRD